MVAKFMCALCGLGRHDGFAHDGWTGYCRAIYCVGSSSGDEKGSEPRISGFARYDPEEAINLLPPEAHQEYHDKLDPLSLITIVSTDPPETETPESATPSGTAVSAWGFRFHDSCWLLLKQACVPQPVDVVLLWRILRSLPHSDGLPFWGHNFGGLYQLQRDAFRAAPFPFLGRTSGLMIPSTFHDPFYVPEIWDKLAQTRIRTLTDDKNGDATPLHDRLAALAIAPLHGYDPFSELPFELREMILAYVNTDDVLPFRLASRTMAALPLSQAFFKSRFWPGRELDVIFDGFLKALQERAGFDWKSLYKRYRIRLRRNLVGLGGRNRVRIWKQTVRPLVEAMDTIARLSELRGKPCSLREPGVEEKEKDREEKDEPKPVTWKFVRPQWDPDFDWFGETRRHYCGAEVDLTQSKIIAIHVSLVDFFGIRYISGLVFETEDGKDIELGYIVVPGSEEPLIVEAGLEGFHVATDECGFRAISPYTTQHMQTEYLDWAGDRAELPVQALKCGGRGTVKRVRAAFDV